MFWTPEKVLKLVVYSVGCNFAQLEVVLIAFLHDLADFVPLVFG